MPAGQRRLPRPLPRQVKVVGVQLVWYFVIQKTYSKSCKHEGFLLHGICIYRAELEIGNVERHLRKEDE